MIELEYKEPPRKNILIVKEKSTVRRKNREKNKKKRDNHLK
jgi:hypothetical protein